MPDRFTSFNMNQSLPLQKAIDFGKTAKPRAKRGRIRKVNYEQGFVEVEYFEDARGLFSFMKKAQRITQKLPMTQPYVGLGWGIYAGIDIGAECFIDVDQSGYLYVSAWRMNPYYLNTDTVKSITKDLGFSYSGDTPLYSIFRQFGEGDLVFVSKGKSGVIASKSGNVSLFDKNGQSITFDPKANQTLLNMITLRETTEAGTFRKGVVVRSKITEKLFNEQTPLSFIQATTGGLLVSGTPFPSAAMPNDVNKGVNEVYSLYTEFSDNVIGVSKPTPTDTIIHTREINVVGDKDIPGEEQQNGLLLQAGVTPSAPPIPVPTALSSLALWFRKVFKSLAAALEFRINKLGRMQLYVAPNLTDPNASKQDVSFESETGAVRLKLRYPYNLNQTSLEIEDDTGNIIEVGAFKSASSIGPGVRINGSARLLREEYLDNFLSPFLIDYAAHVHPSSGTPSPQAVAFNAATQIKITAAKSPFVTTALTNKLLGG